MVGHICSILKENVIVRIFHTEGQDMILIPSADKRPSIMTQSAQNTILPDHRKVLVLFASKIKRSEIAWVKKRF